MLFSLPRLHAGTQRAIGTGVPGGLIAALFIATFVLLAVQAAVGAKA